MKPPVRLWIEEGELVRGLQLWREGRGGVPRYRLREGGEIGYTRWILVCDTSGNARGNLRLALTCQLNHKPGFYLLLISILF